MTGAQEEIYLRVDEIERLLCQQNLEIIPGSQKPSQMILCRKLTGDVSKDVLSSIDSNELSVEEWNAGTIEQEYLPAGQMLDESSQDSIDRVVDDFYFAQEEKQSKVAHQEVRRSKSLHCLSIVSPVSPN